MPYSRLCVACFLWVGLLAAEEKRPRIALALEGGSALGFAHVGVLEWLEENRIPVDAIAGTSMGGLIGGLYAAGYSPAEIRVIAKNANWKELLSGEERFEDIAYRRKEDKIAFPNRIELGLSKSGLQLPAALNDGHRINMLLSRLLLAYGDLKNFDELPTPFRCVATELVSGRKKVFADGPLAEALRSTMSIPALFAPVRRNGEVYVDGGALENLPVDVARELLGQPTAGGRAGTDAGMVLAVHLDKGAVDPKQLGNALTAIGRSLSVMIGAAEMEAIKRADLVLVAELAGVDSMAFHKSEEIAAAGRKAAEAKAGLLRRFAVSEEEYAKWMASRMARRRKVTRQRDFLQVKGAGPGVNEAIQERIEKSLKGSDDLDRLENELAIAVGLGRISSMNYHLAEKDGKTGIEVDAKLKATGPIVLNPAAEVNGADTSNVRFSAGARITWLDVWKFRSEWRTDLWFGSRMGATTELYKPFRPGSRNFIAPRAFAYSDIFDVYFQGDTIAEYRLRQQGVGVDVGRTINRFSELRLGYQWNWVRANQKIGLPLFQRVEANRESVQLRYNFEGQDDFVAPRSGLRLNMRGEHYGRGSAAISGYSLLEGRSTYLKRLSAQSSLLTGLAGGASLGPLRSTLLTFNLGGPQRLGSYGANELQVRSYTLATLGGLYELKGEGSILGSRVFLAGFGQAGKMTTIQRDGILPASVTGAVLVKTFLGPLYFGGSVGDRGTNRWFFGMGRLF